MLARETKILLGLLGTLSSGFVGVLGTKLLVPRPPEGAGPDVHVTAADFERTAIVDPPSFDRPAASAFAAFPSAAESPPHEDPPQDGAASAFPLATAHAEAAETIEAVGDPVRDAEITNAEQPDAELAGQLPPPPRFWSGDDVLTADEAAAVDAAAVDADARAADEPANDPGYAGTGDLAEPASFARPQVFQPPPDAAPITRGEHVVVAGDTWWSVAERAYGDGRLFKPLYAWNRGVVPAVAMTAGTRLQIPPVEQLAAAQAALMPDAPEVVATSASAVRTVSATEPLAATPVGRSIVVAAGDTLISIARDQLGSASRWRDVFEANRETLGRSPGPLTPGTRLMLP